MTGLIGIPDMPWKGYSSRFNSFGDFLPVRFLLSNLFYSGLIFIFILSLFTFRFFDLI
ncbi:hypothetical protein BDV38DRAFT_236226 [Aspergillus pseudotamarii]|uniref:Uncharacterized protein n=1 Tax=Aspergillus pseudotamarii TaxID=132259 RepID=A0A5N6T7U7_ASPPS|nr:uncharacterized protein BDV38DRAFT_236226 [Aspergillus pseudotamarii]KAE8142261.1 hypothetical protein BDV38DRAFT_236226 [Aspergillus pseudotamarii]